MPALRVIPEGWHRGHWWRQNRCMWPWAVAAISIGVVGLGAVTLGMIRHHAGVTNVWIAVGAIVAVAGSISTVAVGHALNPPPCSATFSTNAHITVSTTATPSAALHSFLAGRSQPRLPTRGWHLVTRSEGAAEFAAGRSRVWLTHVEGWIVTGGNVCGAPNATG